MGDGLTAPRGDLAELRDLGDLLRLDFIRLEESVGFSCPCINGDALQVAVGEQALSQGGKRNTAGPFTLQHIEQAFLDCPVEHVVAGLVDE